MIHQTQERDQNFLMESHLPLFLVTEQKVFLKIPKDFRNITGYTEILMSPLPGESPRVIFLKAKQMSIKSILVDDQEAVFRIFDTHKAFEFDNGPIIRDSGQFQAVSQVVHSSPDIIIEMRNPNISKVVLQFSIDENNVSLVRDNNLIYTDNRLVGPSGWFPCIDNLHQLASFSLEIEHIESAKCLGPGNAVVSPSTSSGEYYITRFVSPFPIQFKSVGFALGQFQGISSISQGDIILYSALDDENFRHSCTPLEKILEDTLNLIYDGSDRLYQSIHIVFIPQLYEVLHFPSLVFLPQSCIAPLWNLNSFPIVIPKLAEIMIAQHILFQIPVDSVTDEWIQNGLIQYFADTLVSKYYHNSFVLDRRWNDINFIYKEDIHPAIVLHSIDPATSQRYKDEHLLIKSKLLINMIAQNMKNNSNHDAFLDSIKDIIKDFESKKTFIAKAFYDKIARFCLVINLKKFKEQWLDSNGIPLFTFNFNADSRNRNVKLVIFQTPSCKTQVKCFTGQINAQLMDLDQPYNFRIQVENQFIYHSMKYYAHKPKAKRRIFEFYNTDEKCEITIYSAVLWIELDPQLSWIMKVKPKLPFFMVNHQLELLRNAYSQHQAISALSDWKNEELTQNLLDEMLKKTSVCPGVRGHIARFLATSSSDDTASRHRAILLEYYKKLYILPDKHIPRPNNFEVFSEHVVQLHMIAAISVIRNNGYTPQDVNELLILIAKASNNTGNSYNDDSYQSEIDLALGRIKPDNDETLKNAADIVIDHIGIKAGMPSFRNIIRTSGFIGITSIIIKRLQGRENEMDLESTEKYRRVINSMRIHLREESCLFESKAAAMKCLLYLAFFGFEIGYPSIICDLKILCGYNKDAAALCIREIYRFIQNSCLEGNQDRFESYLLYLPSDTTKDTIINRIISKEPLKIAETLWSILTIDSKYHNPLRSEAFRAYTALYGKDIPSAYLSHTKECPIDIQVVVKDRYKIRLEQKEKKLFRTPQPYNNSNQL